MLTFNNTPEFVGLYDTIIEHASIESKTRKSELYYVVHSEGYYKINGLPILRFKLSGMRTNEHVMGGLSFYIYNTECCIEDWDESAASEIVEEVVRRYEESESNG